ncbi:MAG: hypothetical protein J6V71_00295 [Clostridia bacterium]|nr:hypothetical protein [Clostridia bacterium]
MIYTCRECGRSFSTEQLKRAISENSNIITCAYCNSINEFAEMKQSQTVLGYDALANADFSTAYTIFNRAIDDATRRHILRSPDAYLGRALAQYRVQTVFSENDPHKLEPPQLICYEKNDRLFKECNDYVLAVKAVDDVAKGDSKLIELKRIENFANTIDEIKLYYEQIERENVLKGVKDYSTFIAYEDDKNNKEGLEVAEYIYNFLPTRKSLGPVFFPNIYDYNNDRNYYEAAILYAIDHSKSMLVVADNSIDQRLVDTYLRFFKINGKHNDRRLAFVLYCDDYRPMLPNAVEPITFKLEDKGAWQEFFLNCNNIIAEVVQEVKPEIEEEMVVSPTVFQEDASVEINGNLAEFGSYPQVLVSNLKIENHFREKGLPKFKFDNGWTPLYKDNGNPVCWYKDDVVGDKKYRAVYFIAPRKPFLNSNMGNPTEQGRHGFSPKRIYCFEYRPITWEVRAINGQLATLVSKLGLDSLPFNNELDESFWEYSFLREWLNSVFLSTAFTDKQQQLLGSLSGSDDKILLLDKRKDREYYTKLSTPKVGSDYLRCVGGMCDRNNHTLDSYWIINDDDESENPPNVIMGNNTSVRSVFSSLVAIVPKIIVPISK